MNSLSKLTHCALAFAATFLAGYSQAEEVRINQAFQSLLYLPLYVAQEKGYFKEQGVEVKILTGGGGAQSWAAVMGGSADFSIQDPVFVPKTIENGGEGLVVAAVQNAPSVFILSRDPTPLDDNLQYLKGKKVIVSPQPDTTWAFMSYLVLKEKIPDVKLVNVGIGNELPALTAGAGDYALTYEPLVSKGLVENGLHLVYSFPSGRDWSPYAFSGLTTTRAYVTAHPKATQGVVTAFDKASRLIYANQDEAVEIAKKYFPSMSPNIVKQAVLREIAVQGYPHNALVSKESWDRGMEIALFTKNVKAYPSPATEYSKAVDASFALKAISLAEGASVTDEVVQTTPSK